jgi:hypothetical protein
MLQPFTNSLFWKASVAFICHSCPALYAKEKTMNNIIREQTIILNDQFNFIKNTINDHNDFKNLSQICSFKDEQKSLTFKTEKIHPKNIDEKTISIMLLFSNPHPSSVKAGMFLSEPHSQSFWKRIFECKHITATEEIDCAINNKWTNKTPDLLSECLLSCSYESRFSLFFDCLESLPTNQYGDLIKLFPKKNGRALRKQALQEPGFQNLIEISQQNNIKSWIVFSAEAYRYLVGKKDIAKNAPNRICSAIDDYLVKRDTIKFWDSLEDLKRTIQYEKKSITIYLSLIARRKNWKAENGEKYFTVMLNQIFGHIS